MNKRRVYLAGAVTLTLLAVTLFSCIEKREAQQGAAGPYAYPETKIDGVTDTLHGTPVYDPYRWLENGQSDEVIEWTEAQNDLTQSLLLSIPGRQTIREYMEEALETKSVGAPQIWGGRLFYQRRDEGQDQEVLYMRVGEEGEEIALIDPNSLSDRGIVSLDWFFPSSDGKLMTYGLSQSGDENSTMRIVRTTDLTHLDEVIPRTAAASVAWLPDNSGFYYTRYPVPGDVPDGEEFYHRNVFFHKLGNNPADDPRVFGDGLEIQDWPEVLLSESGRYLVLLVFKGWSNSDLYVNDLSGKRGFVPLVRNLGSYSEPIFLGDDLYVRTNFEAPNYRILKVDFSNFDIRSWPETVPESDSAVLREFRAVGDRLVLNYVYNASSLLKAFDPATGSTETIELPQIGSVWQLSGAVHGPAIYFQFSSFFFPPTVYRYSIAHGALERFDGIDVDVDPARYETEFVGYESVDGTRITMFIIHEKGMKLDGRNHAILTGYGGFGGTETPYFSQTRIFWLRNGGVLAIPHLRGGGEYGEKWHKAGMLQNKQNAFDDFIAAAEYLIENGYTNGEKLAIWGGSNGGLLVGAAETQRPDLFRAVVCGNPLLDMVRYHHFLIARLWVAEYGSSDDSVQFQYIYDYSPYHRVKDGVHYPATLILTSDSDTRVDPLHARKMIARLQAANASPYPQLLRFEFEAGHGAGMPVWKRIDRYTYIYSFIVWQLGMPLME